MVLVGVMNSVPASAQARPSRERGLETTAVLAANALFGGLTAAGRAIIEGKNPVRAFGLGTVGGALHFSAKIVSAKREPLAAPVGLILGGLGSSLVSNGGQGLGALENISLPIGPFRIRLAPSQRSSPIRIGISIYEAAVIGRYLFDRDLRIDWHRTAALGTLAFETRGKYLVVAHGDTADGTSTASILVFSALATEPEMTERHETTHVHQHWFLEENWGRPIEASLRRLTPGISWLPAWVELGFVTPSILWLEQTAFGYRQGPLVRLEESEAEWFERR